MLPGLDCAKDEAGDGVEPHERCHVVDGTIDGAKALHLGEQLALRPRIGLVVARGRACARDTAPHYYKPYILRLLLFTDTALCVRVSLSDESHQSPTFSRVCGIARRTRPNMRVASQLLLLAVVAGQRVLELHDAINDKDLETTRELLDEGYDINEKPPEGVLKQSTPLMYAVRSGFKEGVKLLLKRGADWTIADETGYTPIDACAFHGHFAIMKVLIDHGIPFNEYAWDGFAPLHRACVGTEKAHVYTVEILLKAGADPKLPAKPAPPKQKKKPKKKRKGGQKSVGDDPKHRRL